MAVGKKRVKKVKENQLDVTFQDGNGLNQTQTTKRVNAANPGDALRQATMGMPMPKGPLMIQPAQGDVPGQPPVPGQIPAPGQTPQQPPLVGQNQNQPLRLPEGMVFPQRITFPKSFVGLLDEIMESVDGAKMITTGGRPTVVLENVRDYRSAMRVLEKSKHPASSMVIEGLKKVRK